MNDRPEPVYWVVVTPPAVKPGSADVPGAAEPSGQARVEAAEVQPAIRGGEAVGVVGDHFD